MYVGPNYVEPFDSKDKSYSRNYKKLENLPSKYNQIVDYLKQLHQKKY